MLRKLLTVIIPVFNTENYLERCLESVLNQSYKNIEIIAVDDASTDNSKYILEKYMKLNNNIKCIILQENHGAGNARNVGLSIANGEYIAFIDSDDWVDTNIYMSLINEMEEHSLDVALAGIIDEREDRKAWTYRYKYPFNNQISGNFAVKLLIKSNNQDIFITPMVNNKVYRKEQLQRMGLKFLVNSYNEDDIFSFLFFKKVKKVGVVKDVFYHYFQRPTSITGLYKKRFVDDLVSAFLYLINEKNYLKTDRDIINYFFRNLSFIIDLLFESNLSDKEIKTQLVYIIKKIGKIYSFEELLDFFDLERIENFLR